MSGLARRSLNLLLTTAMVRTQKPEAAPGKLLHLRVSATSLHTSCFLGRSFSLASARARALCASTSLSALLLCVRIRIRTWRKTPGQLLAFLNQKKTPVMVVVATPEGQAIHADFSAASMQHGETIRASCTSHKVPTPTACSRNKLIRKMRHCIITCSNMTIAAPQL